MAEGIEVRHSRKCPAHVEKGAACRCKPTYQAQVYSKRQGKTIRRPPRSRPRRPGAPTHRGGQERNPTDADQATLREAGDQVIAGMKDGSVRKRAGNASSPP
jgi:hypothetical protein